MSLMKIRREIATLRADTARLLAVHQLQIIATKKEVAALRQAYRDPFRRLRAAGALNLPPPMV